MAKTIKKVVLTRFKRFKSDTFEFNPGVTLLAGGNNSGKSTLLQALAVWEYCKTMTLEKAGDRPFLLGRYDRSTYDRKMDVSVDIDDFTPVGVPDLRSLWTNLDPAFKPASSEPADGSVDAADPLSHYTLRIRCVWDTEKQSDRILEFGLKLYYEKLVFRVTFSNMADLPEKEKEDPDEVFIETMMPNIAYMPSLSGVLPKERHINAVEEKQLIGRGLAGSCIRNMIYNLYEAEEIEKLPPDPNDPYDFFLHSNPPALPFTRLQNNLREFFRLELKVDFNEANQRNITIQEQKVQWKDDKFEAIENYTPRDISTQGTGFLQWLSIFTLLYDTDLVDVILLDEPDAHLHASLQKVLLRQIVKDIEADSEGGGQKQVLIATHSTEAILQTPLEMIYSMDIGPERKRDRRGYLSTENRRRELLSGIGSEYDPYLYKLKACKRLIFLENDSDRQILAAFGATCGMPLPAKEEVVYLYNTDSHKDRRKLFREYQRSIPELKCVSLRDLDRGHPNEVNHDLAHKGDLNEMDVNCLCLTWRRTNIENYLLCPRAIAQAAGNGATSQQVKEHLEKEFYLAIPEGGVVNSDCPDPILRLDGKSAFEKPKSGLQDMYGDTNFKFKVAEAMTESEVCEDVKTFLTRVKELFSRS